MNKNTNKSLEDYTKGTQREAERIIEIRENRKGRALTEQEKREIAKKVSKNRRKKKVFASGLVALGMGIGVFAKDKYDEITNKGISKEDRTITIDTSVLGIEEINVKSKEEQVINFKNKIKVTVDGKKLDIIEDVQEGNVKEATIKEINKLETKEQVLDYIKDIYSEEYNKINDDKIGKDDIKLYRDKYMVRLDEDVAKNGDEIFRIAEGHTIDKNRYNLPNGIITVEVNTNNGMITENVAEKDGKYFRIYDRNEKVKKYKENIATKIGKILDCGISVAYSKENIAMMDDDEDYKIMVKNCENKLIEGICERKNNQIYEIEGIEK